MKATRFLFSISLALAVAIVGFLALAELSHHKPVVQHVVIDGAGTANASTVKTAEIKNIGEMDDLSKFNSPVFWNGALHIEVDKSLSFHDHVDLARKVGKKFLATDTNEYVQVFVKVDGSIRTAVLCSR